MIKYYCEFCMTPLDDELNMENEIINGLRCQKYTCAICGNMIIVVQKYE
jgi:hypothetical protein